jgi:proteasome lid subunit RPN8/RPN11
MKQIMIRRPIFDTLLAHVQAFYPQEACGFLAGTGQSIQHQYVIENILQSTVAYEMNAQQQIEAMLHVEELGVELLASYHSHPAGPCWPSPTDIAQAYYPGLLYLIVSLNNRSTPEIKAFKIAENEVEEITLVLE